MRVEYPILTEMDLLGCVGKPWADVKHDFTIDWDWYCPVLNDEGIIVGIIPIDGFPDIEFEVDKSEHAVWERTIRDNRTNPSDRPYFDTIWPPDWLAWPANWTY